MNPKRIVEILGLQPLEPEGGYFLQTYKSQKQISLSGSEIRACGTSIYYLITTDNFSAFHRIRGDEVYHYYCGDSVELFQIDGKGRLRITSLGTNLESGERPQALIPQMQWQACRIRTSHLGWSLLGTTVVPGFEFADFELGSRDTLKSFYPGHSAIINELTRDQA